MLSIHNHNVLTLFPMASESRSRLTAWLWLWGREEWDRGSMSTFTRHVSDVWPCSSEWIVHHSEKVSTIADMSDLDDVHLGSPVILPVNVALLGVRVELLQRVGSDPWSIVKFRQNTKLAKTVTLWPGKEVAEIKLAWERDPGTCEHEEAWCWDWLLWWWWLWWML